jgi:hypothetical protein
MTTVVVFNKRKQPRLEVRHRSEIAVLQEPSCQDAKPQFHLIEPGAMRRSEVEHMLVGRVSQKCSPLLACFQVSRNEGHVAQLRHDATDSQAPMSIQVIQDPVKAFDLREPAGDMTQVSGKVHTGTGRPQVADDFAGRYDERGNESACSVSDVILFAPRGLAGLSRLRRVGTTQCLHSRLFITADYQSPLLIHHGCRDVQLANRLSLGVEVGVVAVEPIDASVRLQVGLVESSPDGRTTHGQGMSGLVDQGGSEVIQRPTGGGTTLLLGRAARQTDQIEPLRGGKNVEVVPTAARPEGRPIPSRGNDCATSQQCGDYSRTRQRFEGWWDGPRRRFEESTGIGRPTLGEWSPPEPSFPIEHAGDPSVRQFPRMGKA